MSEENEIEVYQTNKFSKAFKKLSTKEQDLVDDEIELIIADPEIGELKKGDLSHVWVHKFTAEKKHFLLGYSWIEQKLELYAQYRFSRKLLR